MVVARNLAGRIVFTGAFNRLTSMDVRARQIAEPLHATYIRGRYLKVNQAVKARCVIWVAVAEPAVVDAIGRATPQIFDIINPSVEKGRPYFETVEKFDYLILNTQGTLSYLDIRSRPRTWVIPHHHCNTYGYCLPEERVARPRTVGYVGQPEHLHRAAEIENAVRKLGLKFLNTGTRDLSAYKDIDIGVAWTNPEPLRDATRSNVKLTNFCAFGIPSVVSNYESYRDVDRALGGGAALFASTFEEFLDQLERLITDESLRRQTHLRTFPAYDLYSRETIARQYCAMIEAIEHERTA